MGPTGNLRRLRDLLLLERETETLVIACDSLGGVGPHPGDAVRVEPEIVGYGLARVVLLELAAVRAEPLLVVDALGCAAEPYGARIAAGVARHLEEVGLDPARALSGSTEENMPVAVTSAGIFALGWAAPGRLLIGGAQPGDQIWLIARPKVGAEVRFDDSELPSFADLKALAEVAGVHELIPLGSGGVAAELHAIARRGALRFEPLGPPPFELSRSAGPATAALLCASAAASEGASQATGAARLEHAGALGRGPHGRLPAFLLGRWCTAR